MVKCCTITGLYSLFAWVLLAAIPDAATISPKQVPSGQTFTFTLTAVNGTFDECKDVWIMRADQKAVSHAGWISSRGKVLTFRAQVARGYEGTYYVYPCQKNVAPPPNTVSLASFTVVEPTTTSSAPASGLTDKQLQDINSRIRASNSRAAAADAKADKLQTQLDDLTKQVETRRQEITTLRETVDTKASAADLKTAVDEARRISDSLQKTNNDLTTTSSRLQELSDRIQRTQQQADQNATQLANINRTTADVAKAVTTMGQKKTGGFLWFGKKPLLPLDQQLVLQRDLDQLSKQPR